MSEPLFFPSGLAMNQSIYLEECIKKRLIPFIRQHHSDSQYIFWPDLASSHYAKSVIRYLEEQNFNFVEKKDNPANLPEVRPIENFWGVLKRLVYKDNWQAESIEQLKRRIQFCWRKVDSDLVQQLTRSIKQKVDFVRRHDIVKNKKHI